MPHPPLSDELAAETARLVREHGTVAGAARHSGVSYSTFNSRVRVARERGLLDGNAIPRQGVKKPTGQGRASGSAGSGAGSGERIERRESDGGVTVFSISARITTIDELIAAAKIDTDRFEIATQTANQWQQGSKLPDGTIAVVDLWQIKATFRRRKDADVRAGLRVFMRTLGKPKPLPAPGWSKRSSGAKSRGRRAATRTSKGSVLLELSLPDLHVGKLAWAKETGEAYDIAIARELYLRAVDGLLERCAHLFDDVDRILLPVGNDLLHVDNPDNTTTAGTPQDHDGRWQKAFVEAHRMLDKGIRRCREVAPVDVAVVPGNHDTTKAFCIGEVLDARFDSDEHVRVDNAPATRKYVRHGCVLLGFTHGDKERKADLPLVMARERASDFAECTSLEWHLGHLHKRARQDFVAGDTYHGVVVRTLPSLSGTDGWHARNGYVRGLRAAEAYAWDAREGMVLMTEWRPAAAG